MTRDRGVPARVAGELLIIVVGVLLAFQVENWREAREARLREQSQLAALALDVQETRRRLADAIRRQRDNVEGVAGVLAIAYGAPLPAQDVLRDMLGRAHGYQRLEPVTGAYDAMVSSGDLRLLRDQELRAAVADFFATVGEGYEDTPVANDLHVAAVLRHSELVPFLGTMSADLRESLSYSGSVPPADFKRLLGDQKLMGIFAVVGRLEGNHLRYFEDLDRRAEQIESLLARSMDR